MALTVSLDEITSGGKALLAIKPHWKRVRLGDVGQVLNGFAFKSELFTREGGMPLIRIRDVGSDASETFYTGDFDERYVVHAGDLLVGMDGDFNCARWRGPRSLLNQRVCKVTVNDALYLPRFLDYVLPGYLKAINDATSSITVKHLSSRTIQDIPLPLPPMEEQREIVAELEKQFSRLDEAVANLQRVKANLKRYKAAVLKAAVEGRLVETEAERARRGRFESESASDLVTRCAEVLGSAGQRKKRQPFTPPEEGFSPLPEGWAWVAVEQLAASDANSICAGPFGTIFKAKDFRSEGVPIIFLRHVAPLQYLTHKPGFMDTGKWEELFKPYSVFGGELLLTKLGEPPGVCAQYPTGIGPAMVTPDVIKLSVNASIVISEYLMYYFNSEPARRFATGAAFGTTRTRLTLSLFREMPVPLPPFAEQQRIVAEVDRCLSIVREVEAEVDADLQRAQALRQATLAKAFTP